MFIKELRLYIAQLKEKMQNISEEFSQKKIDAYRDFHNNLLEGSEYYKRLFSSMKGKVVEKKSALTEDLNLLFEELKQLRFEAKFPIPVLDMA
jgi:FtsZ-binding cell division protein ZapB